MIHSNLNHFNCSGIYIIRNLYNNKIYIGSAKNIKQRLHEHNSMLRRNKHHSKYLQNSYNLHNGKFLFSILEQCSVDNLIKREQYWLDYYNSYNKKYGYNNVPKAYSSLGRKASTETKLKMSNSHKGMKKPWSNMNHLKKSIKCVFNDNSEQVFNYIGEASTILNINRNTISRLLIKPNERKSKYPKFYYI